MKEKEKLPDTINLEFGFEMADTVTINGREYRAVESAKEPEVNPWPQEGDVYWYLDDCEADCDTWQDAILDRFRHERGLVFRTAEEAKHADRLRIANAEIRRWRDENCPFTEDWGNEEQKKWYSVYGYSESKWYRSYTTKIEIPNTIYFATKNDIELCQSTIPDAWDTLVKGGLNDAL